MADRGLSLPAVNNLARSSLGNLMPAASTQDLSSASGHHMMLPKMPHVMRPALAPTAETMALRCACARNTVSPWKARGGEFASSANQLGCADVPGLSGICLQKLTNIPSVQTSCMLKSGVLLIWLTLAVTLLLEPSTVSYNALLNAWCQSQFARSNGICIDDNIQYDNNN